MAMPSPQPNPRKLKILCLHGYHGTAQTIRAQLAPLVAGLEPIADFVYVDAPSHASGDFGWWHAVEKEGDPAREDPGVDGPQRYYKGWERTRAGIVSTFERMGPFDGVLGVSQGAALTGLLAGLRASDGRTTPERPLRFDFAVMLLGFVSRDPGLARLYERTDGYALPSLHVIGGSDEIVPMVDSLELASHFASPVLVEFAGGHEIPKDPATRAAVRAFLEERLKARDGALPPLKE